LALDWEKVYLAWTDAKGAIHLANSGDGWSKDIVLSNAGNPEAGPALIFGGGLLYIAWKASNSLLSIATCDFAGTIQQLPTDLVALSGPSLTWSSGNLYVLVGGPSDGTNDQTMYIYLSTDKGQSFNQLPIQKNASIGAPSLAIIEGYYYLVWADPETSCLNFAVTQNLENYSVTNYSNGCHNGGPALLGLPDSVIVGWSYGASPQDPNAHHITLGQLPLSTSAREVDRDAYNHLLPEALEKCTSALEIYDPALDKCVSKLGCPGQCVLQSITVFAGLILFNPIRYAICMINCK
jgi:hypothetical protein